MRRISLLSVKIANFKSFASAEIDLHREPGLRLVFGDNRKKPRLGANGAGKSTIVDAVCFCLNGRSVRGRRLSSLMTRGQKSSAVETVWEIDGERRIVRRAGPPERVTIDGVPAEQRAVDELMGLSRDRFLASVVFGQARPLFIDLPVPERGDLLDEVLGLGFWMRAADLATAGWNATTVEMGNVGREVARLEGAIGELPSVEDLTAAVDWFEADRARQLDELRDRRVVSFAEYRRLHREIAALSVRIGSRDEVVRLRGDLNERASKLASEIAVLTADVTRLAKEVVFFEQNSECPVCGQGISAEFADEHVHDLGRQYDEKRVGLARVENGLATVRRELDSADAELRRLDAVARDKGGLDLTLVAKRGEIVALDGRARTIRDQDNPYAERLRTAEARREELAAALSRAEDEAAVLSVRIERLAFWRQGFRRVRAWCLTRVLAELEVEAMGAARSLGLAGWRIGFETETETKSGTVRLGVRAVVSEDGTTLDFDDCSPGEEQRVRLATSLGLASLIQRHSGVRYDLEVYDEPSAWLSTEGIDDLFECLRERARSRGKAIWVIDPRADVAGAAFDEAWIVVKDANGSRVEIARPDAIGGNGTAGTVGCDPAVSASSVALKSTRRRGGSLRGREGNSVAKGGA